MSANKQNTRIRRRGRTRAHIRYLDEHRLCVHRTPRHVYAQILSPDGGKTLVSASTLDKEVRAEVGYGGNVQAALTVGRILAERAQKAGITKVAFDRSGFRFHGRIKALADAARENGMEF